MPIRNDEELNRAFQAYRTAAEGRVDEGAPHAVPEDLQQTARRTELGRTFGRPAVFLLAGIGALVVSATLGISLPLEFVALAIFGLFSLLAIK
ncbi:MAG: hypothetical protein AAF205_05910 [Pseudomonadota bacterium]